MDAEIALKERNPEVAQYDGTRAVKCQKQLPPGARHEHEPKYASVTYGTPTEKSTPVQQHPNEKREHETEKDKGTRTQRKGQQGPQDGCSQPGWPSYQAPSDQAHEKCHGRCDVLGYPYVQGGKGGDFVGRTEPRDVFLPPFNRRPAP